MLYQTTIGLDYMYESFRLDGQLPLIHVAEIYVNDIRTFRGPRVVPRPFVSTSLESTYNGRLEPGLEVSESDNSDNTDRILS